MVAAHVEPPHGHELLLGLPLQRVETRIQIRDILLFPLKLLVDHAHTP